MSEKQKLKDAIKLAVSNTTEDIIKNAPPQPVVNHQDFSDGIREMDKYERFLRRCDYRDDINTEWWEGYTECPLYDFNEINTVTFEANEVAPEITYVLDAEFISHVLCRFAINMGGPVNAPMVHFQTLGFNQDAFVVYDKEVDNFSAFFNLQVINVSDEEELHAEKCLQYPELQLDISRPKWIEIACNNYDGEVRTERWHGESARYILQGVDASRGLPFWKRASEFSIEKGIKRRNDIFGSLNFKKDELK